MEKNQKKVYFIRKKSLGSGRYTILFGFNSRSDIGLNNEDLNGVYYCSAPDSDKLANRICATYGPMFYEGFGSKRYRIN